ncbi:MAG: rRNA synthase [Desulfonauticus sp.]|nr:rRNA synthase [Desulfonauticus sp.]
MSKKVFIYPFTEQEAITLSKFLARFFSRRQAKDLIRSGKVLVQSQKIKKTSWLLQPGDRVEVREEDISLKFSIRILKQKDSFWALDKPSFLHSIRGKEKSSLEDWLKYKGLPLILLNRLDYLTSGIVLATDKVEREIEYKKWQNQGQVEKFYLVRVKGKIEKPLVAKRGLEVSKRKKVKVLEEEEKDPLRYSWVYPLSWDLNSSLLVVKILKGKRHQIRAHLAGLGFPILGDPLYGQEKADCLFLHHFYLRFPGWEVLSWPRWLKEPELALVKSRLTTL